MAQKESSVFSEKETVVADQTFNQQCFLIHNFKNFSGKNSDRTFENFSIIKGEPGLIISKLLGTGIEEFFNIKSSQLSLLQPKIKLFKTKYDIEGKEKDIELIFDDHFRTNRLNDILETREQRGTGVGLRKFEWEDQGTNPGDSGKSFQATLIIHLQNLGDLFNEQTSGASFADLIRTPPSLTTSNGIFNEKYFRIKVQIGWQKPNNDPSFIMSEKLLKTIENSVITLALTLTDHIIDVNENGTVELTATYQGSIEGKLLSPETDILNVGKKIKQEIIKRENLIKSAQTRKTETIEKKAQEKGFFQKSIIGKLSQLKNTWEQVKTFSIDHRSANDLMLEGIENEIQEREIEYNNFDINNKIRRYKNFLTQLEKKDKIFYIDLDQEDINIFNKIRNENFNLDENILNRTDIDEEQKDSLIKKDRIEKIRKIREEVKNVNYTIDSYSNINIDDSSGQTFIAEEMTKTLLVKDEDDREDAQQKLKNNFEAIKKKKENKTRINFIYFGDLINTALSIIKDGQDTNKGKETFRFLMGPVELFDITTQTIYIVDLADIPISLDLFNSWFLNKVIKPQKNSYLLRDFLKDVCSDLILKSLSPDAIGKFSRGIQNRVSFSIFSLCNDPFPLNSRINIANIDNIYTNRISPDTTLMKQYILLYVAGNIPNALNGEYVKDINRGIYHFFVGSDRGILKKVSFSRADITYLKESRIVNSENLKIGDVFLSEPYNAKMTLMGNSVFKPGMICYIEPRSLGLPKKLDKRKGTLPIGGYYTVNKVFGSIQSGKFETTIELIYLSSGEDSNRNTTNMFSKKNNNKTLKINEIL